MIKKTNSFKNTIILGDKSQSNLYSERTDRNIGWITKEEQQMLQDCTIGIAGCGGMGGLLASILVRLGIGTIKIADTEKFDVSNINRQYGALENTVGMSKAITTGQMVNDISNDTEIIVYTEGVNRESVDSFVVGCDIICDEIEFWAIGSRILLHQKARDNNVSIMNANTVGFQTNLFLFDENATFIEDALGISLLEAFELQESLQNRTLSHGKIVALRDKIAKALVPIQPEYGNFPDGSSILDSVLLRLEKESTASIIATNPPMAAGFLANRVLLQLLKINGSSRSVLYPPSYSGYMTLDAALMTAKIVK